MTDLTSWLASGRAVTVCPVGIASGVRVRRPKALEDDVKLRAPRRPGAVDTSDLVALVKAA